MDYKKNKLLIINTHPISYHVNFYRILEKRKLNTKVFYLWSKYSKKKLKKDKNSFTEKNYLPFDYSRKHLSGYKYKFIKTNNKNEKFGFFDFFSLSLFKNIIQENPKIIMCYGYNNITFFLILLLCKIKGIRFLLKGEVVKHKENFISKIYKFIFFNLSNFIAFSCKQNKKYYEEYLVNQKKLISLPCAVNNNFIRKFKTRNKKKENYFYAGKLIERKNLNFLIDGFIKFNENNNAKLFIIGDGYIKKKLLKKYKKYKNIKFLKHLEYEKLFTFINLKMKYLIITSNYDPSPKIINEVLNLDIPVICGDNIGTAGDLVKNNINGLIFKLNNQDSLISCLEQIKRKYSKLKKNCNKSLKKWDDNISAINIIKILKKN